MKEKGSVFKFNIFIFLFACYFSSSSSFAYDNLEFARRLNKYGYSDLALKYMSRPGGPKSTAKDKKKMQGVMAGIYSNLARREKDPQKRKELMILAEHAFSQSNPDEFEKAKNARQMALTIAIELKDFKTAASAKPGIRALAEPFFTRSAAGFEKVSKSLKKIFEEGMDKILDSPKWQTSKEGKAWVKKAGKFIESEIAYIETLVDLALIYEKGNPKRYNGLEKLADHAQEFGFLVGMQVPLTYSMMLEGRIYGILSEGSKDPKKFAEKSITVLNEVLATPLAGSKAEKIKLKYVKGMTSHALCELAIRNKKYDEALKSVQTYIKEIYKVGKLDFKGYELILNGMLACAHLYAVKKEAKYDAEEQKLRKLYDKNARMSKSKGFWQKKMISTALQLAKIKGEKIENPEDLKQIADDLNRSKKYEDASKAYIDFFNSKMKPIQALKLKPKTYYSLAFCFYKLGKHGDALTWLEKFFDDFNPKDKRFSKLLDDFKRAGKLRRITASHHYKKTQKKEDFNRLQKALDLAEIFDPAGIRFIKAKSLADENHYVDAIKYLSEVKTDDGDYDKALYMSAFYYYKYADFEKKKNNKIHNETSLDKAKKCKEALLKFVDFIDKDTSDLIEDVKIRRRRWRKDANKLLGIMLVSLEEYADAVGSLEKLYQEYSKDPVLKFHSNMRYVLQNLYVSFSSLYADEKQKSYTKKELIDKCEEMIMRMEKLDIKIFAKYENPEERKRKLLEGFYMRLGSLQQKYGSQEDDKAYLSKGLNNIRKGAGDQENIDHYLAGKMLQMEDYISAATYFEKVIEQFKNKGIARPLQKSDFDKIRKILIDDRDRSFFKNNFEKYVLVQGEEGALRDRDYSRFRINIGYIVKPKKEEEYKNQSIPEKNLRQKIKMMVTKNRAWQAALPDLTELYDKMMGFLGYLGIVDDLAICYRKSKNYEKAITYLEEINKHYPGILAEEKKLTDLKLEFVKNLIKENKSKKKIGEYLKQARIGYIRLKNRLKGRREKPKYIELFHEVNRKRYECYLLKHDIFKDAAALEKVYTGLRIIYPDQDMYERYKNVVEMLKQRNKLPADLKELSPEERRKMAEIEAEEVKRLIAKEKEYLLKKEKDAAELEKKKAVGRDFSFKAREFRGIANEKFQNFQSYLIRIKGYKKPEKEPEVKDVYLMDVFNLMLKDAKLCDKIPASITADGKIKKIIEKIKKYCDDKTVRFLRLDSKLIAYNRELLEACYSDLPKSD